MTVDILVSEQYLNFLIIIYYFWLIDLCGFFNFTVNKLTYIQTVISFGSDHETVTSHTCPAVHYCKC